MSEQPDSFQFTFAAHSDAVLSRMNALREDKHFCDVKLLLTGPLASTEEPYCFYGHKVVLAASSDFLRDQFLLHEGQDELRVNVVASVEVGRRLLLSCYTGLLEVPRQELVTYLTAASALRMNHVVEKCAQAISLYLGPTLADLKLETAAEEEEIKNKGDTGGMCTTNSEKEQKGAAKHPTFIQEANVESKEVDVTESTSDTDQSTKFKKVEGGEGMGCCLKNLESEVDHVKEALICKLHNATVFTKAGTESLPPNGKLLDTQKSVKHKTQKTAISEAGECTRLDVPRECKIKYHNIEDTVAVNTDSQSVQKSYLCQQCDQVFQHIKNYVQHMKKHQNYLCSVCDKSNLTHHIRVHSGAKPYRCPLCHKTFSQEASLKDHLNLHTGHKPHKCDYCTVHFAHKPGLRRHLKDVHGKSTLENGLEEAAD